MTPIELAKQYIQQLEDGRARLQTEVAHLREQGRCVEAENAKHRQDLEDVASGIFHEVGVLTEQALGHKIEAGHTSVYAVELLVAKLKATEAERDAASGEVDKTRRAGERLGDEVTRITGECVRYATEATSLRAAMEAARLSLLWCEGEFSRAGRDTQAELIRRDANRLMVAMKASAPPAPVQVVIGEGEGGR